MITSQDLHSSVVYNSQPYLYGDQVTLQTPEIEASELEILQKIGSGCFGNVYRGTCRGKVVAIKKLHQQDLEEDIIEEFRREVEIMTHLRHPNIVLYMGSCTVSGHLAIVTEFLPKGNLADLLHNLEIEISLFQKLKMAKDIAQGMNWLHCSKPPIIHRDLKPTNLLVDENWTVKVCDFGLSAVQKTKNLVDEGDAPGTPLWMSPEVLLGHPLSEKADIYSYGIVLWEIMARKEPFEHMDSYNTFVKAICENKERPPIPPNTPKPISDLFEVCWHEQPSVRPSFLHIIEMLDDITVEVLIPDDSLAQSMWKKNWKGKTEVEWKKFLKIFCKTLKVPTYTPDDVNYQCLRSILAKKKDDKEIVTLENLSTFLIWFGPMHSRHKDTIVDKLRTIMSHRWFHGDISRSETENLLSGQRKKTFLVRLSTTEPQKTPFTISRTTKIGNISHHRVFVKPGRKGYFINHKSSKGTRKIETSGSISDLMVKVTKDLDLKYECSGSKYSNIFAKILTGYEEDHACSD